MRPCPSQRCTERPKAGIDRPWSGLGVGDVLGAVARDLPKVFVCATASIDSPHGTNVRCVVRPLLMSARRRLAPHHLPAAR